METSASIRPGDILRGKYRVERELGAGGMGVVVLATHLRLGQKVAIKVLRAEARGQGDVVRRFAREARAASTLRGEHAVRILDVDDSEAGHPFLVMEYLEGVDLQQRLAGAGALDVADAVECVLQACEGIAEAHAAGIVHRDLKPANLFLTTRADGTQLVKILDFGISKANEPENPADFGITRPHVPIGSPSYMSPEQLKGASDVDARTDIWALGVVLYQLLANALPFEAHTTASLAATIASEPPRPLGAQRDGIPPELEAAVLRCLEKSPAKRFGSVAELARALAPFVARGDSRATRIERVAGRQVQRTRTTDPAPADPSPQPSAARQENGTASLHGIVPSPPKPLLTEYGSTLAPRGPLARRRGIRWRIAAPIVAVLAAGGMLWFVQRQPPRAVLVVPPVASQPVAAPASVPAPPPPESVAIPLLLDAGRDGASRQSAPGSSARPRGPKNPMDLEFR